MAKNLKLNIKNAQIAEAINLSGLKGKLAKKKEEGESLQKTAAAKLPPPLSSLPKGSKPEGEELPKEEAPRIRARSKSAFAESYSESISKDPLETIEQIPSEESFVKETQKEAQGEIPRVKKRCRIKTRNFRRTRTVRRSSPSHS